MFSYAVLNESSFVESVIFSPKNYTGDNYIIIPYFNDDLIGAKYDRETNEFIKTVTTSESEE